MIIPLTLLTPLTLLLIIIPLILRTTINTTTNATDTTINDNTTNATDTTDTAVHVGTGTCIRGLEDLATGDCTAKELCIWGLGNVYRSVKIGHGKLHGQTIRQGKPVINARCKNSCCQRAWLRGHHIDMVIDIEIYRWTRYQYHKILCLLCCHAHSSLINVQYKPRFNFSVFTVFKIVSVSVMRWTERQMNWTI